MFALHLTRNSALPKYPVKQLKKPHRLAATQIQYWHIDLEQWEHQESGLTAVVKWLQNMDLSF